MSFNIHKSSEDSPISWNLPDDFVRLHPTCKYEIRNGVEERLYGLMINEINKEGSCLLCQEKVFLYKKVLEKSIQISHVFHQKLEQRSFNVLAQIEAESDTKLEKAKTVPLPGEGAQFKCDRNDWLDPDLSANSQVMTFRCNKSFFLQVKLYAYLHGVLGLEVTFEKAAPRVPQYFAKIGFKLTNLQQKHSCIYINRRKQVKKMISILIQCNHFPKEEQEWMQRVVNAKDWRELIKEESWKKTQHNLRLSFRY